jgi:hypothetical protein
LIWAISVVVGVNVIGRAATWLKIGSMLGIRLRDIKLLKDVGKIAIAAATAAVITTFVRTAIYGLRPFGMLVVCAAVFGVIFLAGILLLGLPTLEERSYFKRQLSRVWRPALAVEEPVARS